MEKQVPAISAEDKRMIKDVKKLKVDSLMLSLAYMQGMQMGAKLEQQASGALARMQARCDNALRFMPEAQAVRQRREMAEAMLKGAEQDD